MSEEQLRKYWAAYTDAWKLMKNHERVTEQHISQMIMLHGNTVFNRLFCLVVWQEIKRIRDGGTPLDLKQYQRAFDDSWHLFKAFSDPNDTDKYWEDLVCKLGTIRRKYDNCSFIYNLLYCTTLDEIRRIYGHVER